MRENGNFPHPLYIFLVAVQTGCGIKKVFRSNSSEAVKAMQQGNPCLLHLLISMNQGFFEAGEQLKELIN